ncbi:MAG TPA: DsbA family protein [Acidobacteriota bacterium]|nr:DsbA family protein [Acidobacteriota bacterium]
MKTANKSFLKFLVLIFLSFNLTIACASPQDAKKEEATAGTSGGALTAQDTEKIGAYIRKAFNIPPNVAVVVQEGGDQKIPGMKSIKVQFTGERGSQAQEAWISPDQKILVVGRVLDMTIDPYKENLAKINLSNAPVKGAQDAKVTIVEYTDFQCPYCSRAHVTVEQLLKDYDGKIKVAYKALPLNIHNWAEDSAVAAACVSEQNKDVFWKYANFFFQNQTTLTKDNLNTKIFEMAKTNGLDEAALKTCIDSKKTLPQVQADVKEAQALGFQSTPSFVVNGRPVIGAKPIEEFKQIIDAELAGSK